MKLIFKKLKSNTNLLPFRLQDAFLELAQRYRHLHKDKEMESQLAGTAPLSSVSLPPHLHPRHLQWSLR